jgi:hypothetical protein
MPPRRRRWLSIARAGALLLSLLGLIESPTNAADRGAPDALATAAEVDRLILAELQKAGVEPAGRTNDEDFLRRAYLDLAGRLPSPERTTSFAEDADPEKRSKIIDRLLASDEYAGNWARYWRDVIFADPAEMQSRLMAGTFEAWMKDQLKQNRSWDQIATDLLTATGNVEENGATALLVANTGDPAEVAADVSRIFLGIQLECANCHDHPTDSWKREQFHQLAAYFPRAEFRVRRVDGGLVREVLSVNKASLGRSGDRMFENADGIFLRLDRNRDGLLSPSEARAFSPLASVFERLLESGDANEDGSLSAEEMKKIPPPPDQAGRSTPEYLMPDLYDPSSRGTLVHPTFFVDGSSPGTELDDLSRRQALAESITSPENPWFARAFVNRIWTEALGEGFYMPVDDLGPERAARFPEALQVLSDGFTASGYDIRWLMRTIANTDAYQRQIRSRSPGEETLPFASALPTRLRSDQVFTALTQALEIDESAGPRARRGRGPYANLTPRNSFHLLFAVDPSTPRESVTGNVPQALFLMNSPALRDFFEVAGSKRLARLLQEFPDDRDAIAELYLVALCRRPTADEERVCLEYVQQVGNRPEAFEDLLWGLLNSTEFVSRR